MVIFHSYVSLPEGNYYGYAALDRSAIPEDAPQLWVVTGSRGNYPPRGGKTPFFLYQNKLFLLLIVIVHDCISIDSTVVNSG